MHDFRVLHLPMMAASLLALGCEPVGDVCVPYSGRADLATYCDSTLCLPADYDSVAPSNDVPLRVWSNLSVHDPAYPVDVHVGRDSANSEAQEPRLDFFFSAAVRTDDSEASLRANLESLYINTPVGTHPTGEWLMVGNEATVDELTRVGDVVRVRGSYLANVASYTTPPMFDCSQSPVCVSSCLYEGDSTLVTFDVTFDWPG